MVWRVPFYVFWFVWPKLCQSSLEDVCFVISWPFQVHILLHFWINASLMLNRRAVVHFAHYHIFSILVSFLWIQLLRQDNHLNTILEGISERACNREIVDNDLVGLQSILMKLLSHFKDLEDVFALVFFSSRCLFSPFAFVVLVLLYQKNTKYSMFFETLKIIIWSNYL